MKSSPFANPETSVQFYDFKTTALEIRLSKCFIYFCFPMLISCIKITLYRSYLLNRLNKDIERLYFKQSTRPATGPYPEKKVWLRQCQWLNFYSYVFGCVLHSNSKKKNKQKPQNDWLREVSSFICLVLPLEGASLITVGGDLKPKQIHGAGLNKIKLQITLSTVVRGKLSIISNYTITHQDFLLHLKVLQEISILPF